jgi:hypothetical protein
MTIEQPTLCRECLDETEGRLSHDRCEQCEAITLAKAEQFGRREGNLMAMGFSDEERAAMHEDFYKTEAVEVLNWYAS